MNTVKSFWIGWGALCVAGAGSYIAAKREINADRKAKLEQTREKKRNQQLLEHGDSDAPARTDMSSSPSQEASGDPAPTRHAPSTESQQLSERSKFEADVPLRPRRGDRFS